MSNLSEENERKPTDRPADRQKQSNMSFLFSDYPADNLFCSSLNEKRLFLWKTVINFSIFCNFLQKKVYYLCMRSGHARLCVPETPYKFNLSCLLTNLMYRIYLQEAC